METSQRPSNSPRPLLSDPYLSPYREEIARRHQLVETVRARLAGDRPLAAVADWHVRHGLHHDDTGWRFREWLPNASAVWLVGDFSGWTESPDFRLARTDRGEWEGQFPLASIQPGQHYQLRVYWPGGDGRRLPSCATRVCRGAGPHGEPLYRAQVWEPSAPYAWRHPRPANADAPLIYEAHVGMALQAPRVGTFREFQAEILPRIADGGYNCLQLMAIAEHPYYASFGYQVTNFFAVNDIFGTPDDFKALVDAAHGLGIKVIMDLVHSHACANALEGLADLCGDASQFFLKGPRGRHPAWGSCCFDYGKDEVLRFLLSNCRFWLEEYRLDGFRFDGVTSMIYQDHGLNRCFTSYDDYYGLNTNWDAMAYLALANELCHDCLPACITVAEEVSGMPGTCAPVPDGGLGFDFRMAMGVSDFWFKLLDIRDEDWPIGQLWHEVTNHRPEEKTISYVECHDQSLVGGQTFLYRCLGNAMYDAMDAPPSSPAVLRGLALHKMARLLTATAAGHGFLTFMGNEFGHPEWIDFPREGNGWSFDHARRRWDLADSPRLCYRGLRLFEQRLLELIRNAGDFYDAPPLPLKIDEDDKVLAFMRGGFLVVCNFHPTASYPDSRLEVPAGAYSLILDTDQPEFNGCARLQPAQCQTTHRLTSPESIRNCLSLYLPSRCAAIWKYTPFPR